MHASSSSGRASLQIARAVSRDDDYTEDSPEPTPRVQQQSKHMMWTPQVGSKHLSLLAADDASASIPSIPDVPSPYSPPPASLFSGEEWTTTRKRPPREVRTSPPSSSSNDDDDLSMEEVLSPLFVQQNSTPASRKTLLPAVINLKKDLEESQQSLYLLQQENKALEQECDRFQKQLEEWKETSHREKKQHNQELFEMEREIQSLTATNETLQREQQTWSNKAKELENLEKEIGKTVSEKNNLQQQLENVLKKGEELENTLRLSEADKDRLSTELLAVKAHRDAFESERNDLQQKMESLEADILELRSRQKSRALESSKKLQDTKNEIEAAATKLRQENASHKLEIDRLKAMLKDSERKIRQDSPETLTLVSDLQNQVAELQASLRKANAKSNELRAQKTALRKELAEKKRPRKDVGCQAQAKTTNIAVQVDLPNNNRGAERLARREMGVQASFEEDASSDEVLTRVEAQSNTAGLPSPTHQDSGTQASISDCRRGNTPKSSIESSMTRRLGRIRDFAERAAVVQDYRRELEHMNREHEHELAALGRGHESSLQHVLSNAKKEVHTRIKDYKERLKKDFEVKVAMLQEKHEKEMNRIQNDFNLTKAQAEENVRVATVEASSTTDLLRREEMLRKQLEKTIEELEHKILAERHKSESLEMNQHEWERRTKEIAEGIQRECNALFESTKLLSQRNNISRTNFEPRLTSRVRTTQNRVSFLGPEDGADLNNSLVSHSSQIDRALEETEALVMGLVNDIRG